MQKNAYIFIEKATDRKREKKFAIGLRQWLAENWSYCAIFGQIIVKERERNRKIQL